MPFGAPSLNPYTVLSGRAELPVPVPTPGVPRTRPLLAATEQLDQGDAHRATDRDADGVGSGHRWFRPEGRGGVVWSVSAVTPSVPLWLLFVFACRCAWASPGSGGGRGAPLKLLFSGVSAGCQRRGNRRLAGCSSWSCGGSGTGSRPGRTPRIPGCLPGRLPVFASPAPEPLGHVR